MIDALFTRRHADPAALWAPLVLCVPLVLSVPLVACGAATDRASALAPAAIGVTLPGAEPFGAPTLGALRRAWAARPSGYVPRTRHLHPDGVPKYTNRLFLETSPYLRQHAHNPVAWYPWGDEAFAAAKRLKRPVLLSVGYSTCHWCHVMEEESFEDEEIARLLNERYVAIKVDREERPDVDGIYMTAVQTLTGGGGWPMTVWLTADREPFFGGTYFPARDGDRGARTGFLTLLRDLREVHDAEPERVAQASRHLVDAIRAGLGPASAGVAPGVAPGATAGGAPTTLDGPRVIASAAATYRRLHDPEYGGLRGAPKFPSGLPVRFLLRHHRRSGESGSLGMAALTLETMAAGGMFDQIGGGFHRYATDPRWMIPHFEKMLYDNALLVWAYLEGYQATGREEFARTARAILRYVERDMTSPEGAFYSATDADSPDPATGHREEGRFFTWTPAEIDAALQPRASAIARAHYGVTPQGDFEGRTIPHVARPLDALAREMKLEPPHLDRALERVRETLYQVRSRRPAPLRDEKILTAWNGLMIAAFSRAALVLGEEAYAGRAARAARFVLDRLRPDGRLRRSFMDGKAAHRAYLDDYAFLITGLLDLYEATGEAAWLREARALDEVLETSYEDPEQGGYFMTADDHEKLLAREKPAYDGAEPSGNSVQAMNLLRLHEYTTDDRYRRRAARTLAVFAGTLAARPTALSEMLLAVDFADDAVMEIVIVTAGARGEAEPFLREFRRHYVPNRVLIVAAQPAAGAAGAGGGDAPVPLLKDKIARDGKPTAYVCERGVCALPTTDPAVFARQIQVVRPLRPPG